MIIVKLRGGLGNQMFQYAFGKACAVKTGEPLLLDLTWYTNSKRKFILKEMKVSLRCLIKNPRILKVIKFLKKPTIIQDKGFFEEKNLNFSGNTILDGYWESHNYFEQIVPTINKEFQLKKSSRKFTELLNRIKRDSIAVHVRRGDYLIPHGKFVNGLDYYNKGVETIIQNKTLETPEITIFSDDPEWCRKELKFLGGRPTETFEEKLASDAEELILMSHYGHNVISNSTFSWWSAFLNKNPDKMVVMPENWFTDKKINANHLSSIYVPGWIVVK